MDHCHHPRKFCLVLSQLISTSTLPEMTTVVIFTLYGLVETILNSQIITAYTLT